MNRLVVCLFAASMLAACHASPHAACGLPAVDLCAQAGANCGPLSDDGLGCSAGGTIDCGTCTAPETCGGGGTPNLCGCIGEDDATLCQANHFTCGSQDARDRCGRLREIVCGTCTEPELCGGGGVIGACGTPEYRTCGKQWSWFNPSAPPGADRAAWGASRNDVWLVGTSIAHWTGGAWTRAIIEGAPRYALMDISGTSSTDIWAVGSADPGGSVAGGPGLIVHYDGTRWTRVPSPEAGMLEGVWAIAPGDVWAVGYKVIFHYDGSAWRVAHQSEDDDDYSGVAATSATDVWVIGSKNVALRWDGAAWAEWELPFDRAYYFGPSIWASAPDDVWATTGYGTKIAHFDGVRWSATASDGMDDIFGKAPNDVFVAQPPQHWNGHSWSELTLRDPINVEAFGRVSDAKGLWVIHWPYRAVEFEASVWRGVGNTWTPLTEGVTSDSMYDVWMNSPSDTWACGADALFHYDGTRWTAGHSWDPCYEIWASGPNDVWFLGDSVGHWDGSSYLRPNVGASPGTQFTGIWGSASDDIWISGYLYREAHGWDPLLFHFDGHSWTNRPPANVLEVTAIGGRSRTDAWAQAERPGPNTQWVWLHWNGATWTEVEGPAIQVRRFWAEAGGDMFALAGSTFDFPDAPPVWRWNGTAWTSLPDPGMDVSGFCGTGGGRFWVAGDDLVEWNGERWTAAGLAGGASLGGCAIKDGYGWAVGRGGAMLRFCP